MQGLDPCAHQAMTELKSTFFWNVTPYRLIDLPILQMNLLPPSSEQRSKSIIEKSIKEEEEDKTGTLNEPTGIRRGKNI
jgi:hypothetical protein